jgi:D-3-phosphoglycerate dehydrogenase / 2-oxoglutarate reductase
MKILLTSTSFQDTPGIHQDKLYRYGLTIDKLRGPVKEEMLLPIIGKYDGIICGDDEISRNVILTGLEGKLKIISKYGVGLDKIDTTAAKELGMPVTSCPGVNHITVAEHVMALLLTYCKNIHIEHNITQQGKWKRLVGNEIYGKTLGILGLGKIGKEVALRAEAFGLQVKVYDPYADYKFIQTNNIELSESLSSLISGTDILSLNLPLNSSTIGIINKDILSKAKDDLVIINTARAMIIEQGALINALKNKKIKAYLTDVLEEEPMLNDHPLLQYDNVIITPHIGSRTFESVQRQGMMAVNNLFKVLNIS